VSARRREPVRPWVVLSLVVATMVLTAVVVPVARWQVRAARPLSVLIVDKTASDDGREHAAFVWVLEHAKITDPSTGAPYTPSSFVGPITPVPAAGDIPDRPIPRADGRSDLVYVTDTYGVYRPRPPGDTSVGDPADRRVGGLSEEEMDRLIAGVAPGGTFVAEFNTVAGPTPRPSRARLEGYLGFSWTGWAARHFAELGEGGDQRADVPGWVPRQWSEATGRPWPYRGAGWVFAHADGRILVLAENVDIAVAGAEVRFAPAAAERYGTVANTTYDYWFDVVEPAEGTTVEASYHLDVSTAGANRLRNAGLSADFPAIVRSVRSDGGTGYYFAGDWADQTNEGGAGLGPVAADGLTVFQRLTHPGSRDEQQSFFWKVYQPLLDTILTETTDRRHAAGAPR
jgi:hypothetical protein